MVSGAKFIEEYANMSAEQRIDYISKSYSTFMGAVESHTEGLLYMIEEEQDFKRRQEKGDLGVRVQGGKTISDKTATTAIRNVSIRDAIETCNFSDGLLDDVDHADMYISMAETLRRMRRDYRLFNSQIANLSASDAVLIKVFMNKEKDLYEIANELGLTYDSARQKVRRIRYDLKNKTLQFISGSYFG